MADRIYIFAGGGTGGHIYPGLAVAGELAALDPAAKIVFACSDRKIDRSILDSQPYAIVPQVVRPIPRSISGWWKFFRAWRAAAGQARTMIRDLRPAGVLGLGGFAAAPIVKQASAAKVPSAMLNPDAVPGKANKYLGRYCDAIFTQFESTGTAFSSRLASKVKCVGCPIRGGLVGADRAAAMEFFSLRADRKTLLVFGASLGAESINSAMIELAPQLSSHADKWQVLHVTGAAKGSGLTDAYRDAGINAAVIEYCNRMELAYAAADLILCRGGAVTIAELSAVGTPAIIMPYPHHADRQQTLNAQALASCGAAVVVDDACNAEANSQSLAKMILPLFSDDERLAAMRGNFAGLIGRDAAKSVARWMMDSAK